ncbi:hypothetical protein [Pedobacter ghigonis]|uniref:hypothetical protein n=1 Tax=Pedobacter ghigonis TaxID=2730403 RepID=UPI001589B6A1|nr:hypothetical protein [Pedobacter ghigonis]
MKDDFSEQLKECPELDPLGFEQILIIENYNAIFNNLLAGYGRMMFNKHFSKKTKLTNKIDIDYCISRRNTILSVKENFYHQNLKTIREVSKQYLLELRSLEALERLLT